MKRAGKEGTLSVASMIRRYGEKGNGVKKKRGRELMQKEEHEKKWVTYPGCWVLNLAL